jgi:hypothetical protein
VVEVAQQTAVIAAPLLLANTWRRSWPPCRLAARPHATARYTDRAGGGWRQWQGLRQRRRPCATLLPPSVSRPPRPKRSRLPWIRKRWRSYKIFVTWARLVRHVRQCRCCRCCPRRLTQRQHSATSQACAPAITAGCAGAGSRAAEAGASAQRCGTRGHLQLCRAERQRRGSSSAGVPWRRRAVVREACKRLGLCLAHMHAVRKWFQHCK